MVNPKAGVVKAGKKLVEASGLITALTHVSYISLRALSREKMIFLRLGYVKWATDNETTLPLSNT